MSHKADPRAMRLNFSGKWLSRWMDRKTYAASLREDYVIRDFLESRLKDHGVESVEIERFADKLTVVINSSRPGLIIGRGGSGIEMVKKGLILHLRKKLGVERKDVRLEIREIRNPWESASLTAQHIAQQLERRMPFRRVIRQALEKSEMNKGVEGAKIEVSGRLGGAEIARTEKLKAGRLPLQTLRANIDYGTAEAHTTYGIVGVKVWLYKGEGGEGH